MTKPIICKSQGKANGFESCGKTMTEFEKRTYGMCNGCLWDFYHETEIGKIIYQKSFLPKVSLKLKSIQRENEKKMRSNTKSWKTELQTNINKIVRLIDKDLLCLARNQKGQLHAGHVFSRGGNQTIRYNLHNIHRQSAQSNHWQNDDGLLRDGLTNEYGQSYMDFIASLRQTPALEYKEWQYKELSLKSAKIALRLKKLDLTYSIAERIKLRNEINLELGIYESKFCKFKN